LIGLARLVDRLVRQIVFSFIKLLRWLARAPFIGRGIDPLLRRIDQRDRLDFELNELLRVCQALNNENLVYWVAGGWGLDALVGSETRRHGDLDLILSGFTENLTKVASLLVTLGYQRKKPLGGTLWFPDAEVYEDARGHHVEVLNVNWSALKLAESSFSPPWIRESEPAFDKQVATPFFLQRCATTGSLGGVHLPVLSLAAQELFHSGYKARQVDSHADDIIRLISAQQIADISMSDHAVTEHVTKNSRQRSTLLLVPIFSFPADLMRLCRLHHNDLALIPPHVTLAIPFLPVQSVTSDVVLRLSTFFNETSAFDFELSEVRWFDTKVVYLAPSNVEKFLLIIETLQKMFPEFHPYDGEFDSVIPHVTLSENGSLADRRALGRLAPKYLPIPARASHVWMMSNERRTDEWSIVKIFPLAAAAQALASNQV
jgi:hypothetical protein